MADEITHVVAFLVASALDSVDDDVRPVEAPVVGDSGGFFEGLGVAPGDVLGVGIGVVPVVGVALVGAVSRGLGAGELIGPDISRWDIDPIGDGRTGWARVEPTGRLTSWPWRRSP